MKESACKRMPQFFAVPRIALFLLSLASSPSAIYAQSSYRTESAKIFASSVVAVIKVEIAPAFLGYVLNPANAESDSLFPCRVIFQNEVIAGDTLEQVGFRLRGNTSRHSPKKAFKLDLNEFIRGRKFYGLYALVEHYDENFILDRFGNVLIFKTGERRCDF